MLGSAIHLAQPRHHVLYSRAATTPAALVGSFEDFSLDDFNQYAYIQPFFCIIQMKLLYHKPGGLKCVTRTCHYFSFVSLYQLHGWRDRSCDNTLYRTGGRHVHFFWKTLKTTRRFGGEGHFAFNWGCQLRYRALMEYMPLRGRYKSLKGDGLLGV